jgi:hypothetical protein
MIIIRHRIDSLLIMVKPHSTQSPSHALSQA